MMDDNVSLSSGETSSILIPKIHRGSHCFTINKYSFVKGLGVGKCLFSPEFHVGGCSWRIKCYPDGITAPQAQYMVLKVELVDGKPKTRAILELQLVDQSGQENHEILKKSYDFGISRGEIGIMRRCDFENPTFIKDDCIQFLCIVTVVGSLNVRKTNLFEVPPSDIGTHSLSLLESGKGADVVFEVDGEKFSAHKAILASRSSVFDAQFFGTLKDGNDDPLRIQEMDALVFKVLLHFIYCDELPDFKELEAKWSSQVSYHHLVAAADRYDLNRLKLICAAHLNEQISLENVVATWELAERHHCSELAASCIEFATSSNNALDAICAAEFDAMGGGDPTLSINFAESVSLYGKKKQP